MSESVRALVSDMRLALSVACDISVTACLTLFQRFCFAAVEAFRSKSKFS